MEGRILIIYTGGTIGMMQDEETGAFIPFDFTSIVQKVPELQQLGLTLTVRSFDPLVDSSNMLPDIWIELASMIEEEYYNFDGFVILHGTDTMAYSASALSFMLHNLAKPVVFTGSQLPLQTFRTDGKENLLTALEIASAYKDGKALVPEVTVYFQNKLLRGNRTTKANAEDFSAFRSENYPPLAEIGININYNTPYIIKNNLEEPFFVAKKMNKSIALLKLFPGIHSNMVRWVFNSPGVSAVIIETYGSGNAPSYDWFLDIVKEAVERGIIVLNVSQCLGGSVEMARYSTGKHLEDIGVYSGRDITTESAITKLMYLLGNASSRSEIINGLNNSLSGEISL